MKKLIALAVAALALLAFLTFRPGSEQAESELASVNSPAAAIPVPAREPQPIPESARSGLEACLGEPSGLPLEEELLSRLQAPSTRLNWRVLRVEEGRQEYRLRLSTEPATEGSERLQLQIFSVDAEGLPDLLSRETEDPEGAAAAFLEGKELLSEIESMEFRGAEGGSLRIERENGRVVELEFQGAGGRLGCAGGTELKCKCL